MPGPPLGWEGTGVERTMRTVRKRKVRRGTAAQLQVPGPDQRMMGEVWWMEGVWTGPGEGWRGVRRGWPGGKLTEVGRCPQLEPVGRRPDALQKEDKFDSPFVLPAESAVGRAEINTQEGEERVKSRWAVRGRWMMMWMGVQEQVQVLMENLKNRVGEKMRKLPSNCSDFKIKARKIMLLRCFSVSA